MEEFQQRGEGRGSWVSTTDVQIQARKGPEMEKGPLIAEYRFDSFASTCAHVKIIKPLLFIEIRMQVLIYMIASQIRPF